MNIKELYEQYAYIKRPLNEIYHDSSQVPQEFMIEWFKDSFDYERMHSDEELRDFLKLSPVQILKWLEEAAAFTVEIKKSFASVR